MAAPSFPNDMYPPHLNAAIDAATRKALVDASDARAALPGPLRHSARGDITAVLMHMVDDGVLTPPVAKLIAWARGLNPSTNGAYYNRTCKPRIMWHGLDFDAQVFADLYRAECAASDTEVDGLPMTDGLGARQKPVAWLWVDDTLEWPSHPLVAFLDRLTDYLSASETARDVLLVGLIVVMVPALAWCVWEIVASLITIWPWIGGGAW